MTVRQMDKKIKDRQTERTDKKTNKYQAEIDNKDILDKEIDICPLNLTQR